MSLVSQLSPSACSVERRNIEVQNSEKNDTEQDNETRTVGVNQCYTPAPSLPREDDQTNNGGPLVLENRSTSAPETGTKETSIANPQVMTPFVKPDCTYTNLPFDLNSAFPLRIDHLSIHTSGTALSSDELFEPSPASEKGPITHAIQLGESANVDNGSVAATSATKESAFAIEILMDSDYPGTREEGDFVVLADKGKGVDPRERGNATYDPNSIIVPVEATSTGGPESPDFIELVGLYRDKRKNVDPEERGNGMAKDEPGPSSIDFHYHGEMSSQIPGIPLESFELSGFIEVNSDHLDKGKNVDPLEEKTNRIAKGKPGPSLRDAYRYHDLEGLALQLGLLESFDTTKPTVPRLRWHPKISPYRFIVLLIPLFIGTVKAVLSQMGSVTTPITLEWISGVVISLVIFLLGSYETQKDMPKYLSYLFEPDCMDLVWYLAAKLSIQRLEYLSNEDDLKSGPGALVTTYRVLVSTAVIFLGTLKCTLLYLDIPIGSIWVEWLSAGILTSFFYLVGLYENNSLWLGDSFFREDYSKLHKESALTIPMIFTLAYLSIIYGARVLPGVILIPSNYLRLEDHTGDLQLPMGPVLSQGTLAQFQLVVMIYIPSVVLFLSFIGPLMFHLWVGILASTSMSPYVVRHGTRRFVRAIKRLSQTRPTDQIIYHLVALGQLLLFVGWNVWIFLYFHFINAINKVPHSVLFIKEWFYFCMVPVLIYTWIIIPATVPSSIKNATVTKFIQQLVETLRHLDSSVSYYFVLFTITGPNFVLFCFVWVLPGSLISYSDGEEVCLCGWVYLQSVAWSAGTHFTMVFVSSWQRAY